MSFKLRWRNDFEDSNRPCRQRPNLLLK